jgi:tetratricopeptide (TPR) repeat protein
MADPPINAKVARLIRRAHGILKQGYQQKAHNVARDAFEVALLSSHRYSIASAAYTLATILWADSDADLNEVLNLLGKAQINAQSHSDTALGAKTLMARVEAALGNYEAAETLNEELLTYYVGKNSRSGEAEVLRNLGELRRQQGDFVNAPYYLNQSLNIYRELGDSFHQGAALLSLGAIHLQIGAFDEAENCWREALALGEKVGEGQITRRAQNGLNLVAEVRATQPNEGCA